jgi:hypothetical protein
MSTTNWAARTKQAVAAVPVSKPAPKGERGERFEGVIESIKAEAYKTGTIGFTVKLAVKGLERPVYTRYFTRLMNKETGDLTDNTKGAIFLDKFLTACGLTADERLAFPKVRTPNDEKAQEALNSLVGSELALYLVDREYMGKVSKEVKAVFPLTRD